MTGYGASSLSERQKQVLRLLLRGHDAKSSASTLGISVHTVNEYLRDARRNLGVTSSREAARMLLEMERDAPNKFGDEDLGVENSRNRGPTAGGAGRTRLLLYAGGFGFMIILAIVAVALRSGERDVPDKKPVHTSPPRVVATSPKDGAVVKPGPLLLSVTFDQAMSRGDYSFVQMSPETFPECPIPPQVSVDRRTFTLRCRVRPGGRYEVWFNREPYMSFRSDRGIIAQPSRLVFRARQR